jgi:hypothetical protein
MVVGGVDLLNRNGSDFSGKRSYGFQISITDGFFNSLGIKIQL